MTIEKPGEVENELLEYPELDRLNRLDLADKEARKKTVALGVELKLGYWDDARQRVKGNKIAEAELEKLIAYHKDRERDPRPRGRQGIKDEVVNATENLTSAESEGSRRRAIILEEFYKKLSNPGYGLTVKHRELFTSFSDDERVEFINSARRLRSEAYQVSLRGKLIEMYNFAHPRVWIDGKKVSPRVSQQIFSRYYGLIQLARDLKKELGDQQNTVEYEVAKERRQLKDEKDAYEGEVKRKDDTTDADEENDYLAEEFLK